MAMSMIGDLSENRCSTRRFISSQSAGTPTIAVTCPFFSAAAMASPVSSVT